MIVSLVSSPHGNYHFSSWLKDNPSLPNEQYVWMSPDYASHNDFGYPRGTVVYWLSPSLLTQQFSDRVRALGYQLVSVPEPAFSAADLERLSKVMLQPMSFDQLQRDLVDSLRKVFP